jgi:hypothetical protein
MSRNRIPCRRKAATRHAMADEDGATRRTASVAELLPELKRHHGSPEPEPITSAEERRSAPAGSLAAGIGRLLRAWRGPRTLAWAMTCCETGDGMETACSSRGGRRRRASLRLSLLLLAISISLQPACRQSWKSKVTAGLSMPSPAHMRVARGRAVAWLAAQQQPDGAVIQADVRAFEVWDTLQALAALNVAGAHADQQAKAWSFVRQSIRDDGVAYHFRNRGTATACTETTAFLHLHAPQGSFSVQAACALLERSTDDDGTVRVNTEVSIIPERLQRYESVTGFALLLGPSCSTYWSQRGALLMERARQLLRAPERIDRPWQYFGTEYYALLHLVWGLRHTKGLTAAEATAVAGFVERRQRADGAILSGGPSPPSRTSEQLHTVLALNALVLADAERGDKVLARGLRYLLSQQQPDGRLPGGAFIGTKQEDLYATALLIHLLQRIEANPRR